METTILENNKLIAEFRGYYQPKESDDLFSFEVYASKEKCREDYPNEVIVEYTGDDIENFQFVDIPKYYTSWDWLMPVVDKLQEVTEEPEELDNLKDLLWWGNIEAVYNEVVDCIKRKN